MKIKITPAEALSYHARRKTGKFQIAPTKPLSSIYDLSLAYTPGVAFPCLEIHKDPSLAYLYTTKSNTVAVISNGTAVLGLGNLGALASKPVMEGKSVLFKKFADIDSFDLEIDTHDVDTFVSCVKHLAPGLGGINLEDIKAPECFLIEEKLKKLLHIPVFHDDQHGTAICVLAGILNALALTGKKIENLKIVINGAGAAAIASAKLLKKTGVKKENLIMVDRTGVIHEGRTLGMNPWKQEFQTTSKARSLKEAAKGADVLIGLSAKGAFSAEILQGMADQPVVFAMANPDPEITPHDAKAARPDVIIATGRSDYPNQVNNALCFPYLFRGALDVHATQINDEMKIAAAQALANLAKEPVPEEVAEIYSDRELSFGPNYIIPVPFDSRLLERLSIAVAEAAIKTGVAQKSFEHMGAYRSQLRAEHNPTYNIFADAYKKATLEKKTVFFSPGQDQAMLKAAYTFEKEGLGRAVLIGNSEQIEKQVSELSLSKANLPKIQSDLDLKNAQTIGVNEAILIKASDSFDETYQSLFSDNALTARLYAACDENRRFFLMDPASLAPSSDLLAKKASYGAGLVQSLEHTPHVVFVLPSNHTSSLFSAVSSAYESFKKAHPELQSSLNLLGEVDTLQPHPAQNENRTAVLMMPCTSMFCTTLNTLKITGYNLFGPILTREKTSIQIAPTTAKCSDILNLAVIGIANSDA